MDSMEVTVHSMGLRGKVPAVSPMQLCDRCKREGVSLRKIGYKKRSGLWEVRHKEVHTDHWGYGTTVVQAESKIDAMRIFNRWARKRKKANRGIEYIKPVEGSGISELVVLAEE